ncbi:hypothetical protein SAMN05216327_12188 [Dyadobacter sp. SG02]|uniref:hypothetical protein n=1 Tax=Dyadobacter sp. SG02 TaxID=1855291 RepID=UPI0008BA2690|nr:hypothetical protein [Dyadobacter sp. SG02]SEJ81584.1 hypothetical protein SAMN05216327_12188 [Dyadobacter sp. SG02]
MAATNDLIPDFEDFERYYGGQMPAEEQRALEGRMLDEPLVADAYEGFLAWRVAHSDAASVRADLRDRLNERVARERKPALPLWAYASAASVLLVLFAYWTFFLRANQPVVQNTTPISRTETAKPAEAPLAEPVQADDKVAETSQPAVPQPSKAPLSANPKPAGSATGREDAASEAVQNPEFLWKPNAATAVAGAEINQDQVTVPSENPEVAPATPSQPAPDNTLVAPEALHAVGKSVAARSKVAPSKPSLVSQKAADTVPGGPGEMLSEVVVVGATTQSKKSASAYSLEPDRPAPVPASGWGAYRAYLDKNTDSSAVTGQITVTFIVNATGALSGFIARGPEELQKEAIRIISVGPAWAPARTKGMPVAAPAEIQLQFRQAQ